MSEDALLVTAALLRCLKAMHYSILEVVVVAVVVVFVVVAAVSTWGNCRQQLKRK